MDSPDEELKSIIVALAKSQEKPLSILKLESQNIPVSNEGNSSTRSSDASESLLNPSPFLLQGELNHYKELFKKLRFSYMEQVTKEYFLQAITDDPPQLVEPEEMKALAEEVAEQKLQSKAKKAEVRAIFDEIETTGKRVCEDYVKVNSLMETINSLPLTIAQLEEEIASLMHLNPDNSTSPHMNLPLGETLSQLTAVEAELLQYQRRIDNASRAIPSKQRKLEALDCELKPLEQNKQGVVAFAEEAVKKRDEDRQRGLADRENSGRWYRSAQEALLALVGDDNDQK